MNLRKSIELKLKKRYNISETVEIIRARFCVEGLKKGIVARFSFRRIRIELKRIRICETCEFGFGREKQRVLFFLLFAHKYFTSALVCAAA